jgi:hypothetical protein
VKGERPVLKTADVNTNFNILKLSTPCFLAANHFFLFQLNAHNVKNCMLSAIAKIIQFLDKQHNGLPEDGAKITETCRR